MTLQPTREEWLAAHRRAINSCFVGTTSQITTVVEAALGPCPQEPAPSFTVHPYEISGSERPLVVDIRHLWGDPCIALGDAGILGDRVYMDADTARDLIEALDTCVRWLRKQGGQS